MSKKFTVQLYTLHFRCDGSLLVNISGGRRQFPATPVGVERQEIFVSYGAEIITDNYFILSHYMYLTDRQNCGSNTVHYIKCSRMVRNVEKNTE